MNDENDIAKIVQNELLLYGTGFNIVRVKHIKDFVKEKITEKLGNRLLESTGINQPPYDVNFNSSDKYYNYSLQLKVRCPSGWSKLIIVLDLLFDKSNGREFYENVCFVGTFNSMAIKDDIHIHTFIDGVLPRISRLLE